MIKGAVSKIESFGLVDGPGIRTVVFLSGCKLRCKYCHNPEMWIKGKENYTVMELVDKIKRNKPYFKNNGGVTFSGGEPLLQIDFLIEVCKELKKENINIAIDTAGVGLGDYKELFSYIDLVLLDIKNIKEDDYIDLTGQNMDSFNTFLYQLNESNIPVWIRQVIVPGVNDNISYINDLAKYLERINNIKKIEFLPYHKMGDSKYDELGIVNPYKDKESLDIEKSEKLYNELLKEIKFNI